MLLCEKQVQCKGTKQQHVEVGLVDQVRGCGVRACAQTYKCRATGGSKGVGVGWDGKATATTATHHTTLHPELVSSLTP